VWRDFSHREAMYVETTNEQIAYSLVGFWAHKSD